MVNSSDEADPPPSRSAVRGNPVPGNPAPGNPELLPRTVHPSRHRSTHAASGRTVGWVRATELTLWGAPGCAVGLLLAIVVSAAPHAVRLGLAVLVAVVLGYLLALMRLGRAHVSLRDGAVAALAFVPAIATVAIVSTVLFALLPGTLDATLRDSLSWSALVFSLAVGFLAAIPVSRWLIGRGLGSVLPGLSSTGRRVRR
jgi:hypothetical protein